MATLNTAQLQQHPPPAPPVGGPAALSPVPVPPSRSSSTVSLDLEPPAGRAMSAGPGGLPAAPASLVSIRFFSAGAVPGPGSQPIDGGGGRPKGRRVPKPAGEPKTKKPRGRPRTRSVDEKLLQEQQQQKQLQQQMMGTMTLFPKLLPKPIAPRVGSFSGPSAHAPPPLAPMYQQPNSADQARVQHQMARPPAPAAICKGSPEMDMLMLISDAVDLKEAHPAGAARGGAPPAPRFSPPLMPRPAAVAAARPGQGLPKCVFEMPRPILAPALKRQKKPDVPPTPEEMKLMALGPKPASVRKILPRPAAMTAQQQHFVLQKPMPKK